MDVWLESGEVTSCLSTYKIYAHTHKHMPCPLHPNFCRWAALPCGIWSIDLSGPTRVNVLFTICLLASNFHLSDWLVWLEHRPEAEVHGEWLYCLVLYLSLSGLENYSPPPPTTTLQLGSQEQQKNGHCRGAEGGVCNGYINCLIQAGRVATGSAVPRQLLGCFQVHWRLFKQPRRSRELWKHKIKLFSDLLVGLWIHCGYHVIAMFWDKLAFCTCFETTKPTVRQDVLSLTVAAALKTTNNNVSNHVSHQMPIVCLYVCINVASKIIKINDPS